MSKREQISANLADIAVSYAFQLSSFPSDHQLHEPSAS